MTNHIDRAAEVIAAALRSIWESDASWNPEARDIARALADAGLLVTPEHDAAVAAKAWDEGFKQGGPMHDVNYDDPDAHTRNPYKRGADRIEREEGESNGNA